MLKNYYSGFLNRNPIIIDRILLALNITPNNSFGIIELEKYFKLVRLSYVVDNQLKDLINFVIKVKKLKQNKLNPIIYINLVF